MGLGYRLMNKASLIVFFMISAFAASAFMGCNDNDENNLQNLVEVSFADIDQAIINATKNQDPTDIYVGQYFKYEDNYQIELNEPQINAYFEGTILEVTDSEESLRIVILETDTDLTGDDGPIIDKKEEVYVIPKNNNIIRKTELPKGVATNSLLPANNQTPRNTELKAYNLEVSTSSIPFPKAIQKRMNCHPENPCSFTGHRVKFLLEERVNNTQTLMISVDRIYMQEGSFLTGLYSSCQSRFVDIGSRDYYVKQCTVLRDSTVD